MNHILSLPLEWSLLILFIHLNSHINTLHTHENARYKQRVQFEKQSRRATILCFAHKHLEIQTEKNETKQKCDD